MSNWLDDLLGNKKGIEKEAEQTDASQEWTRKVKANSWIAETMATDEEALAKEMLEKEAAEKEFTTPEEVIDEDRERQVKALSNKALAEALAEYRLQGKGLPENFSEEKEKAEKKVDSDRGACEKELLKFVGDHSQLDWKVAFEKWSKDEVEHTEAKDIESDEFKAGKQTWEKKAPDFEPTKEEVKEQTEGIGHEEEKKAIGDEKLLEEQRKEASLEIENKATKEEVLKVIKTAEAKSPWVVVEKDGQEMIARVENSDKTIKESKESEEDEKDLQK